MYSSDNNLHKTSFKTQKLQATDIKTHRKNEYLFGSPLRENYDNSQSDNKKTLNNSSYHNNNSHQFNLLSKYKFRSPLRQQQIQEYNRVKTQLKKSIQLAKQNINMNHHINHSNVKYVSIEEYYALQQEQKYQTERLLIQIDRLHQNMYEIEKNKNNEIQKLKQEYENVNFLNMSNIRQNHLSQIDQLQNQLRKTKELLQQKTSEYDNLYKKNQRQTRHLTNQNNRLNQELKKIIQKKNQQILNMERLSQKKSQKIKQQNQNILNSLRQTCNKQLKSLENKLSKQQNKVNLLMNQKKQYQKQNVQLISELQNQKQGNKEQYDKLIQQERLKYSTQRDFLNDAFQKLNNQLQAQYKLNQQFFENQLKRYKNIIKMKTQDRDNLLQLHNQKVQFLNYQLQECLRENVQIKQVLNNITKQNQQQTQILKVKMSSLHQNDLKLLVQSYEKRINNLIQQIKQKQNQTDRIRKNLFDQTNNRYEMRKRFNIQLSKLNAKIIKLRSGLSAMEIDMKQKLENQRSVMLLTSRSIIKDVQNKTQNHKFYDEQLRKLRQLFDLQTKQIEQSNVQVQEKIKIAQQQLGRLSKKIIDQKNSHKQTENIYKEIINRKDQQIESLKNQLYNIKSPQFDNSKEIQLIQQLKDEVHAKNVQLEKLKDQINFLNKKIGLMKSQIQQYQIQNSISQQQAKKQFQRISIQNMQQFKIFYENRLKQLQKDKLDLKQIISAKQQKIISLVKKYQQLEKLMNDTVRKIKKRTQLENKVINIGMDNNLLKNMTEIVKFDLQEKVEK